MLQLINAIPHSHGTMSMSVLKQLVFRLMYFCVVFVVVFLFLILSIFLMFWTVYFECIGDRIGSIEMWKIEYSLQKSFPSSLINVLTVVFLHFTQLSKLCLFLLLRFPVDIRKLRTLIMHTNDWFLIGRHHWNIERLSERIVASESNECDAWNT